MTLVIFIILLAFVFDFLNGFHDASNSIATMVSTRIMRPHQAVLWAAFFNFIAFLVFHLNVAAMIGTGLISPQIIDAHLILSALLAAVIWNLVTWYFGIPSSSSHALIGGMVGAAMVKSGLHDLKFLGLFKVGISIVLWPLIGFALGLFFIFIIAKLFFYTPPYKIDAWFRRLQFASAALISLGHGGNDAQKTMGIIAILLFSSGILKGQFYVPWWVIISCNLLMALGTMMGGWRIVKTMGMRITKLKPVGGFCAESAGAVALFLATILGIPVSTTHTITGAIVGVGSLHTLSAVRWGVARRIVWAWVLTLPASAGVAAVSSVLLTRFGV